MDNVTTMTTGKKIGLFFLGLLPFFTALALQLGLTIYFMTIYMVQQMMQPGFSQIPFGSTEYNEFVYQTELDFLDSPAMSFGIFTIYIVYLTLYGLWYYYAFCDKSRTQPQEGIQKNAFRQLLQPHCFLSIFLMGITMQISLDIILELVLPLFPSLYEEYTTLMETANTPSVFMILSITLFAPVGEELIFRGITRKTFQRILPWQLAIILQALLFGIYHMNLVQGVYTFLMGLIAGYLVYRFDSVLPGILLHMSLNCSSYFAGFLLPESLYEQPLAMISISIVTFAITLVLVYCSVRTPNVKKPDTDSRKRDIM